MVFYTDACNSCIPQASYIIFYTNEHCSEGVCYFFMEKGPKKAASVKSLTKLKLVNAYKKYLLHHGIKPATVHALMSELGHREEEFYKYFSDFVAIDNYLWSQLMAKTIKTLHGEEIFSKYTAREKLLALYYTLIEVAKKDRSYFKLTFRPPERPAWIPDYLQGFKSQFDSEVKAIVEAGVHDDEIVSRPLIGKKYHEALWLQLLFVLRFWMKDTSSEFENTDAAIEKSVNLAFELMGKGPLDLMLDFGKFLYHNR